MAEYIELINRLRQEAEFEAYLQPHSANETPKLLSEAADAIEELQAQLMYSNDAAKAIAEKVPKWISVTERLPETIKEHYWVCTDTGYQCECRWTNNQFGCGESDEWDWNIFDIPQYHKVVAWMPLHEPYEPPKEET